VMGWDRRRPEELLVVHQPARADRAGREPGPSLEHLPADVERVAEFLRGLSGPEQRAAAFGAVQSRFGNSFAARVVALLQRTAGAEDDEADR